MSPTDKPARLPPLPPMPRSAWVARLHRLAGPVLQAASTGRLQAELPVRCHSSQDPARRAPVTHLEALARTLAGLAPWLDATGGDAAESEQRDALRRQAVDAIAIACDPLHPSRLDFAGDHQAIVDGAFLAHAVLRAPRSLADGLDGAGRTNLITVLASTRDRLPCHNNWLLFAAMIEAALHRLGAAWDPMRVDYALRSHESWYLGDGAYGDGAHFHWDYYNSFVIQPMLLDVLETLPEPVGAFRYWSGLRERVHARFVRAAAIQERLIAADGSFPPIGRSLAYRCGAFQLLAQAALQHRLPPELPPAQARCALGAVIARTLDAPGTWDGRGWLMPGLCGHQPGLMERYISTGSLYLASTAFLPLGLPPEDPFWSAADQPWTQRRLWSGEDGLADHAMRDG